MSATKPAEITSSFFAVSKHRIDALSDGVFAIVMTLLVLELKVPDLERRAPVADIRHALAHERPVFLSFVITFLFAALFWYLHHVLLNFIEEFQPRTLVVLNLAFLMFVSLLPFSVGMLGRFMENPLVQTLYFANHFFLALLLLLQWSMAKRNGVVREAEGAAAGVLTLRLRALCVGAVCAAVTAWYSTRLSFYVFMLVVLLSRVLRNRKYGRERV